MEEGWTFGHALYRTVITVGEAVKQSNALFASASRFENGKVEIKPEPKKVLSSRDSLVIFVKDEDVHPNVVRDEHKHFEAQTN